MQRQPEVPALSSQVAEKIQTVLGLSLRSPSGDNCQPWQLTIRGDAVEIGIDQLLAQHTFNNRHHASLISVGMLVESITLLSPELGLRTEVDWLATEFASLDNKSPWVRITFADAPVALPSPPQATWAAAIRSRSTQRGSFNSTGIVLSHPKFDSIKQSGSPLVSSRVLSGQQAATSAMLTNFICRSEQYAFSSPAARRDFFYWVRCSRHETESTNDGMPWHTLGLKPTAALALKTAKRFPLLQKLFSPIVRLIVAIETRRKITHAGGIVLLSVRTARPESVFEVGRVAMHQWLRQEQMGFAVQPISAASLCVFDVASGAPLPSMPTSYKTLFRNGFGTLADAFCLNAGETPIWMYRFGNLEDKPTTPTPRRHLTSFLTEVLQQTEG